ncbi:hypothetical protein JHK85_000760 [Glycine max]|nr:hypothetical protein JHK85_000760 [Glycine max]
MGEEMDYTPNHLVKESYILVDTNLGRSKPNTLSQLFTGVDDHIIEKILDHSYLDGEANTFSSLKSIVQSSATIVKSWVGEAGGAYNSGHHLVSDAFVYNFWLV